MAVGWLLLPETQLPMHCWLMLLPLQDDGHVVLAEPSGRPLHEAYACVEPASIKCRKSISTIQS